MVVRVAAPQQLIRYRPDVYASSDYYGHRQASNVDTRVNTGVRSVRLMTDAEGFRVGRAGRIDGEPRVLLLGDSYLQALQVEYEQSYAGLLEAGLARQLGRPVAVRNTGVSGWDVNHYHNLARERFARERYAAVVVTVTLENDLVERRVERHRAEGRSLTHPPRLPRHLTRAEIVEGVLYPINDWLEGRSHLFILARRALGTVRMRMRLSPLVMPNAYYRSYASKPAWDTTAAVLVDLARMSERRGVPTLFVLMPSSYQVDEEVFRSYVRGYGLDPRSLDVDQPNRILGHALREAGVNVIDALPALRAAQHRGARLYESVDPHLSAQGHQLVYRLVQPEVLRMLAR
jgi:hypothetical protein